MSMRPAWSTFEAQLSALGFRPSRRFGQNFLRDENMVRAIVRDAELAPGDFVLEVGPGLGFLTRELCAAGARLLCCEVDARLLEIARCMITRPRVLMLDEPAAGLNPQEKVELQGLIERLRSEQGVSVLLIEHDMSLVMGVSERILVMEHGKPIATGTPEAIRSDERVIKAYLGEE